MIVSATNAFKICGCLLLQMIPSTVCHVECSTCFIYAGELQFTLYIPIVDTLNYFPVSQFLLKCTSSVVLIGTDEYKVPSSHGDVISQ